MQNYRRICLLTLVLLGCSTLWADDFHYKNTVIGDRAGLMGGAYVAISDDSTGAYYNPAGLAYSIGESISVSGQTPIKTSTRTYEKALWGNDFVRSEGGSALNNFGATKKVDDVTLAFSWVVPESVVEHQDQIITNSNGVNKYYQSNHLEQEASWYGLAAAHPFGRWSGGVSMYYAGKSTQKTYTEYCCDDNSSFNSYTSSLSKDNTLVLKFGFQSNHLEPLTIGIALTENIALSKSVKSYSTRAAASGSKNLAYTENTEISKKPMQLSLGVAYFPTHDFLFAFDVDYFTAREENLENVLNYAFGTEWFYDAQIAILGGYFTNNDNRAEPTASSSAGHEKLDMSGISVGGSYITDTTAYTAGLIYSWGNGKANLYGDSDLYTVKKTSISVFYAASALY